MVTFFVLVRLRQIGCTCPSLVARCYLSDFSKDTRLHVVTFGRIGRPFDYASSRTFRIYMAARRGRYFLNWQPSTKWSKKLGLVSSSMWVMVAARVSMVWRLVALVSMIVAPWREALPILVIRSGEMMRSNSH